MAQFLDAFGPAAPPPGPNLTNPETPLANPVQGNSGLAGRWSSWMANPQNAAMLLQIGINLMQPRGIGQSVGGHIGRAVGAGFEARDRQTQAAYKQAQEQRALQNQEEENTRQNETLKLNQRKQAFDEKTTTEKLANEQTRLKQYSIALARQRAAEIAKQVNEARLLLPRGQEDLTKEQYDEIVSRVDNMPGFGLNVADSIANDQPPPIEGGGGPLPLPAGVTVEQIVNEARAAVAAHPEKRPQIVAKMQMYGIPIPEGI